MNTRPNLLCAAIAFLSAPVVHHYSPDKKYVIPHSDILDAFTLKYEKTIKIKADGRYIAYSDKYTSVIFGNLQLDNMETWTDISDNPNIPNSAKHGTIFSISYDIIDSLIVYGE